MDHGEREDADGHEEAAGLFAHSASDDSVLHVMCVYTISCYVELYYVRL